VTKLPEGGYTTVETIQFLKDIVPENPAPANSVVKGLTAQAGSEMVTLRWNALPNISGYLVEYWLRDGGGERKSMPVNVPSATITGLSNLKTYLFTVTPTDGSWEGKPSAAVTATPQPAGPPDQVVMVTVSALDGALGDQISEWIVAASWQPFCRITEAALPVKAPNTTVPSTSSAMRRASVVLPVPA